MSGQCTYNGSSSVCKVSAEIVLQKYDVNSGSWNDYKVIEEQSIEKAFSDTVSTIELNFNFNNKYNLHSIDNISAGLYMIDVRVTRGSSSPISISLLKNNFYVKLHGIYYPEFNKRAAFGTNGIIFANSKTSYFKINNTGENLQIIAKGLKGSNDTLSSGELYQDQDNYLKVNP